MGIILAHIILGTFTDPLSRWSTFSFLWHETANLCDSSLLSTHATAGCCLAYGVLSHSADNRSTCWVNIGAATV